MKTHTLTLVILFCAEFSYAQVQIVNSAASGNQVTITGTYNQVFDIPVTPNPAPYTPWVSNSTLVGWYAPTSGIHDFGGGLLSLGPSSGGGDRALGAAGSIASNVYFALRLQNLTSSSITGASVEFDGEQWYRLRQINGTQIGPQVTSKIDFSYKIFESGQGALYLDDNNSTWTYVPELTFVSPNATLNTSQIFLDGNAPENSARDIQALVTGFTLAPGQELWLRWSSQDVPGGVVSHGLGIDNLSVSFITAIPEPAAFAGLAGLGALGLALSRRRTRLG